MRHKIAAPIRAAMLFLFERSLSRLKDCDRTWRKIVDFFAGQKIDRIGVFADGLALGGIVGNDGQLLDASGADEDQKPVFDKEIDVTRDLRLVRRAHGG